eukprot:1303513-Pyramimonas_sp.AAC.1
MSGVWRGLGGPRRHAESAAALVRHWRAVWHRVRGLPPQEGPRAPRGPLIVGALRQLPLNPGFGHGCRIPPALWA